jgi:hypothetical protein
MRWRHGPGRGVAVYGTPWPPGAQLLADHLAICPTLRPWARQRGINLDDSPESLVALDQAVDVRSPEQQRPRTADCGLYLGTVLVGSVASAHWQLLGGSYPVVRLRGADTDVVRIARSQAGTGRLRLAQAYQHAVSGGHG